MLLGDALEHRVFDLVEELRRDVERERFEILGLLHDYVDAKREALLNCASFDCMGHPLQVLAGVHLCDERLVFSLAPAIANIFTTVDASSFFFFFSLSIDFLLSFIHDLSVIGIQSIVQVQVFLHYVDRLCISLEFVRGAVLGPSGAAQIHTPDHTLHLGLALHGLRLVFDVEAVADSLEQDSVLLLGPAAVLFFEN